MSQKAGCSTGLNEAALQNTVRRLLAQGYREVAPVQDASRLQPLQFMRRRESGANLGDAGESPCWQVLWREA
jgi:hypothetical protein